MGSAGLLDEILDSLQAGQLRRTVAGRRWTAVEAEVDGELRCGLAATWAAQAPAPADLGERPWTSANDLARTLPGAEGPQASLAAAALNALLPRQPERWLDVRLEEIVRSRGAGRRVAMIGHFPFADSLRPAVGRLTVVERRPRAGDLPEAAAAEVLPASDVIVITGLAFVNRSLPGLLELCPAHAHVILAGASVPLSPILFRHGVHQLCGSIVEDAGGVMDRVARGEGLRGSQASLVRRVTLNADGVR